MTITGQCGGCKLVYHLANHAMCCPRCKSTDILWATNLPYNPGAEVVPEWNPEAAHARIQADDWGRMHEVRRKLYTSPDYPGRLSSPYSLTEGELKDVAELERMMTLEGTR